MTTNYRSGHDAEKVAATYLEGIGYIICDINWRTRVCEIDIVAKRQDVIYFVEVKYRRTGNQGGGLDYITPKKLSQMDFAAKCWVSDHKYQGDYELSAVEVSADFKVTEFLPQLS